MKSYCKRVGIPLLILTLLVSVMAPLITLAEDPPPSYETDDWTEFNKLEVADDSTMPANSLALSIARA